MVNRTGFGFYFLFLVQLIAGLPLEACADDLNRAAELRRDGRTKEALILYDSALARNPLDADALVGRGFCEITDKKSWDNALRDFDKVLLISPDYIDASIGKAMVLRRKARDGAALTVLKSAVARSEKDAHKLRYLCNSCWQMGYVQLARKIEKALPGGFKERPTVKKNQISLSAALDRLDNGNRWKSGELFFLRQQRPDFSAWLMSGLYRRNTQTDPDAGFGLFFKQNHRVGYSYELFISGNRIFLPAQRHKPSVTLILPAHFMLAASGDFARYSNAWARIGRMNLDYLLGGFTLGYALSAGVDNTNSSVAAHVLKAAFLKEEAFGVQIGASTGNETNSPYANEFTPQTVNSLFADGTCYLRSWIGLKGGYAAEWRDQRFFRNTLAASIFYKF